MSKITYENKVALNENPSIADINKVKDTDMNEIKDIVNGNDNQLVIDTIEPEDLDNLRIWVNPDDPLQNVGTEVVNSLDGNETNMAPSVNAVKNGIIDNFVLNNEIKTNKKWINGKPIYRSVYAAQIIPNGSSYSFSSLGISSAEAIISINGYGTLSGTRWRLDYKMNTSGSFIASYIDTINKELVFEAAYNGTPCNIDNARTILEYTKTTD